MSMRIRREGQEGRDVTHWRPVSGTTLGGMLIRVAVTGMEAAAAGSAHDAAMAKFRALKVPGAA